MEPAELFDRITIEDGTVVPVSGDEVDAAATELGIHFPNGYREFMAKFGEGYLDMLLVHTPAMLLSGNASVAGWRDSQDEFWHWDESADVLPFDQGKESVYIADTVGGDQLVYHPDDPEKIYFLPVDGDPDPVLAFDSFPEMLLWISSHLGNPDAGDYYEVSHDPPLIFRPART